ncbi:uncharacterized protein CELE_Y116F11B.7 [Caenorhabditis elegans]|uniref:Uncharacterized protein n=1 Tax=Caenorhabditis elegans TaxID=6239 RepID=Q9NEK2_CAEEL|nr:Uncharacterized protein CELE_Y116F11B.7 [Caenorhabditis elegans]CAB81975.3 Uncharacterized protein CELE_Y116F11B.7 [Caenorhabditis elegans]|eukprot:NP_507845.3 Uncharacterized protein CELE_Y116F11B.7 [Caenorhabditis elegans]
MATLDHLLEELFEACSVFDKFPVSFNRTLIDELVDCLDFEEPTLTVIRKFVRNLDFEGKLAPIRMVIRLLDAAIKNNKFRNEDDLLLEFIQKSEAILSRPRNRLLLQDLFNFYTNPVVFAVREPESWLVVIRWVMNEFADEYLSCFHIDLFVKFICQIPSAAEARRLNIISEAISPDLVGSFSARIIYNYAQDLTIDECNTFVNNFRLSSLGYRWPAIRVLLKMRELHPSLVIPLAPASWTEENRRVDVICRLLFPMDFDTLKMMDVQLENVEALVDSVLDSPVDIDLKEKMLDHMNERQFEKYFDELLSFAKIESNDVNIHVTSALRSLPQHATRQKVAQLFEALGDKILDLALILNLSLAYGSNAFDFPEFEKFKDRYSKLVSDAIKAPVGESNAERIITVLECMKLFPCFLPVKA